MKKQILSILLTLCMVLCILPTGVFAEGERTKDVSTVQELTDALADGANGTVRLTANIITDKNLTVDRTVKLDLNGYVLRYYNPDRACGNINVTGNLTLIDSNPNTEHRFTDFYGFLLMLDETNGDKIAKGGIISNYSVCVDNCTFTMNSGSFVGCQGLAGAVEIRDGIFIMNDGLIIGCYAAHLGAVLAFGGTFNMNGGIIKECTASAVEKDGVYLTNGSVMNANGGEVDGFVLVEENSKLTTATGSNGVTAFRGEVKTGFDATIEHGIFYGEISTNEKNNGRISGVTVTYKNGDNDYAKQVLQSGKPLTRPADPTTKRGHTLGWYKTDGTEWDYVGDTVTDDITLYAKWTPNTYTVTFDGNGGTVARDTMTVTYGEELDQMPIPRYKGYFFDGWFDRQSGGRQYGDKYGRSTVRYDKTEDCTLYARWVEAPLCTVTFDPNGGTLNGAATSEEKQNERISRPDEEPERKGYTFIGWYKDAACTQRWDFDDPIPGNMTLYAGWRAHSYTITIKPENGGQDIWITEFCDTAITSPTLTRPGYIFAGWDKEFPTKMPADDLIITAQWTVCDHSGHTGEKPTCTTGVICTACGGTIAALGHDFSIEQHDGNKHWKKCSRCDATDGEKPHDWDNGLCQECGYVCLHNDADKNHTCDLCGKAITNHIGGKANCNTEAVCEICGESYGGFNATNHANLKHISAKKPTETKEGNIEYWYCDGCDKYYGNATATEEINKSDTVIKKLSKQLKSPKTGDNSNFLLWISLLFIIGGVGTVFTVKYKRAMLTRR